MFWAACLKDSLFSSPLGEEAEREGDGQKCKQGDKFCLFLNSFDDLMWIQMNTIDRYMDI